jgi:hypothetical protein
MKHLAFNTNTASEQTKAKLWDRQAGEPEKAWYAFTIYRDAGTKRNQRNVIGRLVREAELKEGPPQEMELPPVMLTVDMDDPKNPLAPKQARRREKTASRSVSAWSREWNWLNRCKAWDAFCDAQLKARTLTDTEAMRKSQQETTRAYHTNYSVLGFSLLKKMNTPEGRAWLDQIPMDDHVGLVIECGSRINKLQEAQRRASGVLVKEDENTPTSYVWELRLVQPPARRTESSTNGTDEESEDPFDVPPAPDNV